MMLIQMGSANEVKANVVIQGMLGIDARDVGPIDPIGNSRLSKSMTALAMPAVDLSEFDLACPLYIIQGDSDTMGIPSAIKEQISQLHAMEVKIYWVEGAGHLLHLTHSDDVARAFAAVRRQLR